MISPKRNDKFELPDGSYSTSKIYRVYHKKAPQNMH